MTFDELWPKLDAAGDWEPAPPPKSRDAVTKKLRELPPLLGQLYTRADGGSIAGIDVFQLDELENVNVVQKYRKKLPGAVMFASDGGDKFLFVDTTGKLGRGAGAVMSVPRDAADPRHCALVAATLESFFEALVRGERPWTTARTLGENAVQEMVDLVLASTDKYRGEPYVVASNALLDAANRCDVRLPSALTRLLRARDGLDIHAVGIHIWPASKIEPVPGTSDRGYAGLIAFANDDAGNLYGVATGGWRDLEREAVVRISAGGDPATAPTIGSLAALVIDWLRR